MRPEIEDLPAIDADYDVVQSFYDLLKDKYGVVWTVEQFPEEFELDSLSMPDGKILVRRKVDGVTGTLQFWDFPRFYYNFEPLE